MAHELEQMAYTGAVPWHGLGHVLDPNTPVEEWVVKAGLDWEVSMRPVQYHAEDGLGGISMKTFKDRFVLARNTDNRPFTVVSNRYKPVQPKQILEFFRDLVRDFGMSIETAGSLRNGQRVWALAKTNDAFKVMGVDEVQGYLMLATSYDLTFSTLAQFTSVRVVCNNTLQQSFKSYTGRVSIPHFRDFDEKDVKEQMGVGRSQWEAFTGMLSTLSTIRLDVSKANEVLGQAFQLKNDPVKDSVSKTHMSNIINLFTGKAIGSDIAGQTGWGLVNATTEYLQHHKRARSQDNRIDSAWFGESAQLERRVVDQTLLLAA